MLCRERSRSRRGTWVEFVVENSEGTPQTEAETGIRALVHQLMDRIDVAVSEEMIKSLLELVTGTSEHRIWAVIAVFYLLKDRRIGSDMIEIVPVSLLLNPGYCGDIEQFCLLRLLLRALLVFNNELQIKHDDVVARIRHVMQIVTEKLLRCLLKDLYKLCRSDPEYLTAMFHLDVWNIIACCFNYARSGALVGPTRKLKRLATNLLVELPPDRVERMRSELLAIKPEAIIWMLWADDMWDYLPDVLDMLAEYPRLMETEQSQAIVQRVRDLFCDEETTWAVKMSSAKYLESIGEQCIELD